MGEAGLMCLSNILKQNYLPNLITLNVNRKFILMLLLLLFSL